MKTFKMFRWAISSSCLVLLIACQPAPNNAPSANHSLINNRAVFTNYSEESVPYDPGSLKNQINKKRYLIIDRELGNIPMCSYDIPGDWKKESQIIWNYQNFMNPVIQKARFSEGITGQVVELFPGKTFFWVEPATTIREGQVLNGGICMRPRSPVEAFVNMGIHPLRGHLPGFKVLQAGKDPSVIRTLNMPELFHQLGMDINRFPGQIEGINAVITYQENGKEMEEEFLGIYVRTHPQREPYAGLLTQTNWSLPSIASIKSLPGNMSKFRKKAYEILASVNYNPQWVSRYKMKQEQIAGQINGSIQQGYASIEQAGRMSKAISAQNDAFLKGVEQWRKSFNSKSNYGSYSSGTGFSDYIRGTDRVDDPYWGEDHQIQGGYDYNYTDGFGNYLQSNNPLYDPNTDPSVNSSTWTLNNPRR